MQIELNKISKVTLEGREIEQLWRILKYECEGALVAEQTTYDMYCELRRFFE